MKNLHQIKTIEKALSHERDKYILELAKIKSVINKKNSTIASMISYSKEYTKEANLQLTKTLPGLTRNLNLFLDKLLHVVEQAQKEVLSLEKIRSNIILKLNELNMKLKLMNVFETKAKLVIQAKIEKQEQLALDDISASRQARSFYE